MTISVSGVELDVTKLSEHLERIGSKGILSNLLGIMARQTYSCSKILNKASDEASFLQT